MRVTRMMLGRGRPQLQQTRSLARPLSNAVLILSARKRGMTHMANSQTFSAAITTKGRYNVRPRLAFPVRLQHAALFSSSSSSRRLSGEIKTAQINNGSHRSSYNLRQPTPAQDSNSSNDNSDINNTNNMSDHSEPEQDSPFTFKAPKWITASLGPANSAPALPETIPVLDMTALRVEASTSDVGHRRESGPTLRDILQTAAANDTVPPETTSILEIRGDMPCNEEWEILSQHFPAVRYLSVAAGFEERWTDGKFPLNWPLELLVVSDAGAERVATPAILEGRVRNLVLCYTCGLRFEGPSTKELMKDAENIGTIPRRRSDASAASKAGNENDVDKDDGSQNSETKEGDAAAETPSSSEEEEQDGGIKITSVPHEWSKYLNTKYEGKSISFPRDPPPGAPPSQMTSLSVLGNDCLETFTAMAMAHPHLLHGLQSLTLYAASQWDLLHVPTVIFPAALQSLDGLKELKLTLGSAMHARLVGITGGGASEGEVESEEEGQEQAKKEVEVEEVVQEKSEEKREEKKASEEEKEEENEGEGEDGELEVPGNGNYLHWMLPPGLEKLSIQGPVSMIPQLNALANAFESAEFLPNLKSISLVLDLPESKDPLENDDGEDEAENSAKDEAEERDEKKEEEKRLKREEEKEKQFAEQLAEAHAACKKVLDVAVAKRGAVVEGHEQPWSELFPALFKKVDKRWLELDGEKKE